MRAHAHWYFQRYSLREKKTFLVCVVLYMYGMQQTKSNVNIIHFKEMNIIDKYVDLLVTYWKVCTIVMVWENEHILNSNVYTLLTLKIMGTRAAAFTAKIKNLNEIQMRLMQGSMPLPQVNPIYRYLRLITIPKDYANMIHILKIVIYFLLLEILGTRNREFP